MPPSVRILSVCLNPAWQKTLFFDAFDWGTVNRAQTLRESGGGKGVNLARALRCSGTEVTVAFFAGGATGEALQHELGERGIGCLPVPVPGATRVCTTIVDRQRNRITELIEPSSPVPRKQVEHMRELIRSRAPEFDGLALCGTYPPGVPESLYADAARSARAAGAPVLLDAVRGVDSVLREGVDVLKINRPELCELTGERTLPAAVRRCLERYRPGWVAVTDGPHRACLGGAESVCLFTLPPVTPFCNAIGAGDCASGVMLAGLARGGPARRQGPPQLPVALVVEAFVDALAAASASCMTDLPAVYDPACANALRGRITRDKVDKRRQNSQ